MEKEKEEEKEEKKAEIVTIVPKVKEDGTIVLELTKEQFAEINKTMIAFNKRRDVHRNTVAKLRGTKNSKACKIRYVFEQPKTRLVMVVNREETNRQTGLALVVNRERAGQQTGLALVVNREETIQQMGHPIGQPTIIPISKPIISPIQQL